MNDEEKKTAQGFRVGDRIAYVEDFGAVVLEVWDDGGAILRFDDGSKGWHDMAGSMLNWRRLKSKKITFKKGER